MSSSKLYLLILAAGLAANDPAVRLQIQLRYAQLEGREEMVSKLESAIEQGEKPAIVHAKPVDRFRPTDSPR